jgi:hypothetical protein
MDLWRHGCDISTTLYRILKRCFVMGLQWSIQHCFGNSLYCVEQEHYSCMLLFMSMGWDYVSELQPPVGLLFTPQCHFFCHKSHMEWRRREHGTPRWEAINSVSHGTALQLLETLNEIQLNQNLVIWPTHGETVYLSKDYVFQSCLFLLLSASESTFCYCIPWHSQ